MREVTSVPNLDDLSISKVDARAITRMSASANCSFEEMCSAIIASYLVMFRDCGSVLEGDQVSKKMKRGPSLGAGGFDLPRTTGSAHNGG